MRTATDIDVNRCERCNRKLSDPYAQYGWRCAEILGVAKNLNSSGDRAYDAYMLGIKGGNEFLRKNNIPAKNVNLIRFYESYVRNYCTKYEPGTRAGINLGNTQAGDGYHFRGAGYIQISGRYNYQAFSDYLKKQRNYDPGIMSSADPAKFVADNYAWEAAGWWWMANRMNDKIAKSMDQGMSDEAIFKQVSNGVALGNIMRQRIRRNGKSAWSDTMM